jgi:hypothetical protein
MLGRNKHTRRQGFLELVGLLIVMEDEGVEQALAADLEFDLGGLLVALYPCSWERDISFCFGLKLWVRDFLSMSGTYMRHLCAGRSGGTNMLLAGRPIASSKRLGRRGNLETHVLDI